MLRIYQLPVSNSYCFRSYEEAKAHNFSLDDYVRVFSTEENDTVDLEEIFGIFNGVSVPNWAKGFSGRSLSVSDIVSIDGTDYYCDNIGWKVAKEDSI